jgi:hypothetical protein
MNQDEKLPSTNDCNLIYKKLFTPENVIIHSKLVSKISMLIANLINQNNNNIKINVDLVEKSALLHDCFKFLEFDELVDEKKVINHINNDEEKYKTWFFLKNLYFNFNHCDAGYEYFKLDYPKLGLIIKKHDYKSIISEDENIKPSNIEEKIVSYADKRVMHSNVVSLNERFNEGLKRWKLKKNIINLELIEKINNAFFLLEDELIDYTKLTKDEFEKKIMNIKL